MQFSIKWRHYKNKFNVSPDKVRVVIDGVHTDFLTSLPKNSVTILVMLPGSF